MRDLRYFDCSSVTEPESPITKAELKVPPSDRIRRAVVQRAMAGYCGRISEKWNSSRATVQFHPADAETRRQAVLYTKLLFTQVLDLADRLGIEYGGEYLKVPESAAGDLDDADDDHDDRDDHEEEKNSSCDKAKQKKNSAFVAFCARIFSGVSTKHQEPEHKTKETEKGKEKEKEEKPIGKLPLTGLRVEGLVELVEKTRKYCQLQPQPSEFYSELNLWDPSIVLRLLASIWRWMFYEYPQDAPQESTLDLIDYAEDVNWGEMNQLLVSFEYACRRIKYETQESRDYRYELYFELNRVQKVIQKQLAMKEDPASMPATTDPFQSAAEYWCKDMMSETRWVYAFAEVVGCLVDLWTAILDLKPGYPGYDPDWTRRFIDAEAGWEVKNCIRRLEGGEERPWGNFVVNIY